MGPYSSVESLPLACAGVVISLFPTPRFHPGPLRLADLRTADRRLQLHSSGSIPAYLGT